MPARASLAHLAFAISGTAVPLVGATFLGRVQLEQHGNRLMLIPTE
jgi:hypothetical protein